MAWLAHYLKHLDIIHNVMPELCAPQQPEQEPDFEVHSFGLLALADAVGLQGPSVVAPDLVQPPLLKESPKRFRAIRLMASV